ncbi:MAG: GNAT family N-acetyltransferase [Cytophagaceae bacterium]|jgi:RimJ/RimL family protein N-acetyltransferase|nr:GNAT family N-acetyltransferase [Cytophagaceae bacterium]
MELRKATMEDWELLLDWRNDPLTRQQSHCIDPIDEQTHRNWLQSVLNNPNRHLYIGLHESVPMGTVRADWNDHSNSYELSWTIAPQYRGKGLGILLVSALTERHGERYTAEVKTGNFASEKIALRLGLSLKEEKNGIRYFSNF